jgi:hypothetical protein
MSHCSEEATRFPCLDGLSTYTGCVGRDACASLGTRACWTGESLSAFGCREIEVKGLSYRRDAPCATCAHAVEVPSASRPRPTDGEYSDERLFGCDQGQWYGLASLHDLNSHRLPLRAGVGPDCEAYSPAPDLRPELLRQRQADANRSRQRRQKQREMVG